MSAPACPPTAPRWAACSCRSSANADLAALLASAGIEAKTQKDITDRAALTATIRRVRGDGYSIVDEELELGLRSIAVPIRDLLRPHRGGHQRLHPVGAQQAWPTWSRKSSCGC